MFTFITFVAGVITGIAGLIGTLSFLMWKYPHHPEHIIVNWDRFYSEGLRYDPKLSEGAHLPFPHRQRSDDDIDWMIEEALGDINTNTKVTHTPKRLTPSEESTRIHEAGHTVMVLKRAPLTLHYAVGGGFRNTYTGDVLSGMISHGETDTYSEGLVLYGGYAAEMVFFGKTNTVLMGSDMANAFAQAYFLHWNTLMNARESNTSWPPMHPWCALGTLGAEHRDPAVLEAIVAICDKMREESIRIITEEREAVQAIADALKEKPVLKRQEIFDIWEKFHPGVIAKLKAADDYSRNAPVPTGARPALRPAKRKPTPPDPPPEETG